MNLLDLYWSLFKRRFNTQFQSFALFAHFYTAATMSDEIPPLIADKISDQAKKLLDTVRRFGITIRLDAILTRFQVKNFVEEECRLSPSST
jgi:hypothetical protein